MRPTVPASGQETGNCRLEGASLGRCPNRNWSAGWLRALASARARGDPVDRRRRRLLRRVDRGLRAPPPYPPAVLRHEEPGDLRPGSRWSLARRSRRTTALVRAAGYAASSTAERNRHVRNRRLHRAAECCPGPARRAGPARVPRLRLGRHRRAGDHRDAGREEAGQGARAGCEHAEALHRAGSASGTPAGPPMALRQTSTRTRTSMRPAPVRRCPQRDHRQRLDAARDADRRGRRAGVGDRHRA